MHCLADNTRGRVIQYSDPRIAPSVDFRWARFGQKQTTIYARLVVRLSALPLPAKWRGKFMDERSERERCDFLGKFRRVKEVSRFQTRLLVESVPTT